MWKHWHIIKKLYIVYFDVYENIISGNDEEKSLNKILLKSNEYALFLKDVWLEINKFYKLPEVEWIIKM